MSRWTKGAPLIAATASILGIWSLFAHAQATCLAADVAAARPPATETKKQGGLPAPGDPGKADRYAREITRRSGVVVVSKALAEDVKRDVDIVLSAVTIKAHAGRDGRIAAYEVVQIDRGSIPERLGFRPNDLISEVNGVPPGTSSRAGSLCIGPPVSRNDFQKRQAEDARRRDPAGSAKMTRGSPLVGAGFFSGAEKFNRQAVPANAPCPRSCSRSGNPSNRGSRIESRPCSGHRRSRPSRRRPYRSLLAAPRSWQPARGA